MSLSISDRVRALGEQAQGELIREFSHIDAVAQENAARVLDAFQTPPGGGRVLRRHHRLWL